jgi:ATP-binding cassette, subfamily C, bacterial
LTVTLADLQVRRAFQVASRSGLLNARAYVLLVAYYAITVVAATLDGVGVVVLVSLLTGTYAATRADPVTAVVMQWLEITGISPGAGVLLATAATLIGAKVALNIVIDVADAAITAHIRLRMQRAELAGVLGASWELLRERRAGKMTAALIEETYNVGKYLVVAVRGGYFFLSATVFGLISLAVSPQLALLLAAVCLPVVILLRTLLGAQARLSIEQAQARQALAADANERLSNLFQIKIESGEKAHLRTGLRRARDIARLEVRIGAALALITNTNNVTMLVALGAFYGWTLWRGIALSEAFALLASIGLVGAKAANHLNGALTAVGNLARLSGSLLPVHELMHLPPEPQRQLIRAGLVRVEAIEVSYRYSAGSGLEGVNLYSQRADPLLIRGPSGSGKTTLANLIAGIYLPSRGNVQYLTGDGTRFDSRTHKVRVGYVPQDISLFHGRVRDNLQSAAEVIPDGDLWQVLERVGAAEFVRRMGGLDGMIAEGGRSLSGGEKRRLGIARALACRPDVLILDEITNGLDNERKAEISDLVEKLSPQLVIIAITHDPQEYRGWREWRTSQQGALLASPSPGLAQSGGG